MLAAIQPISGTTSQQTSQPVMVEILQHMRRCQNRWFGARSIERAPPLRPPVSMLGGHVVGRYFVIPMFDHRAWPRVLDSAWSKSFAGKSIDSRRVAGATPTTSVNIETGGVRGGGTRPEECKISPIPCDSNHLPNQGSCLPNTQNLILANRTTNRPGLSQTGSIAWYGFKKGVL